MKSTNHTNPTTLSNLPNGTTSTQDTKETNTSLLVSKTLGVLEDPPTKGRSQSIDIRFCNPRESQFLDSPDQERHLTEGSMGCIITKEVSKSLFKDIQKGILIKRKKPVMLFGPDGNQITCADVKGDSKDNVILPAERAVTQEDGIEIIDIGATQQTDYSRLSPGLDKMTGSKTSKKVTFAAKTEISVISPKTITEPPIKTFKEVQRRAVSNERSFNVAYRYPGERLNIEAQKQNARILSWSSTRVNRTNLHAPNFRGLDIKSLTREAPQNIRDLKAPQISNSNLTESPSIDKARSKENNVMGVSSRDILTQKINSAKLPSIISLSIKAYNKSPVPPPSQEKSTRDTIFKKAVYMFERESLGKTKYNPSPYNARLLNDRKAT